MTLNSPKGEAASQAKIGYVGLRRKTDVAHICVNRRVWVSKSHSGLRIFYLIDGLLSAVNRSISCSTLMVRSVSNPARREHPLLSSEKIKVMEISYVRLSGEIQPD